jgi:two-component system alkaline phosphatase synthesis response regulator PhoP
MTDKIKLLLVDDEPDILEFLSYNFRKHNFEVITASQGQEALSKATEHSPALIISDILMPQMDGIELSKELKSHEQTKHIPIIFLTAVHDDYKVLYAMSTGADQYVSKPVRFDYLLTLVQATLLKHQH